MFSRHPELLATSGAEDPSTSFASTLVSHRKRPDPRSNFDWETNNDAARFQRDDSEIFHRRISDTKQRRPWRQDSEDDPSDEEDELDVFGTFDPDDDDAQFYNSFPEYPALSSSLSNVDTHRHFKGEDDGSTKGSPISISSDLSSPGIPIWEDDWFKWRSREESNSDSDEDEMDNKKVPSKHLNFGGGPEEGLHLKCNMVWVL